MRKLSILTIGMAMIAGSIQAEFLEKGTQSIRLDYIWADDTGLGDSDMDGVEIGFGGACYEMDDLAVVYGHLENSDFESDRILLSAQEHYIFDWMPEKLVPFLGFAAGYGWLDVDGKSSAPEDDLDEGAPMIRAEAGFRVLFCEYFGLNLSARFNYATDEIFPDGAQQVVTESDLEDTNYDFAFGVRFYY